MGGAALSTRGQTEPHLQGPEGLVCWSQGVGPGRTRNWGGPCIAQSPVNTTLSLHDLPVTVPQAVPPRGQTRTSPRSSRHPRAQTTAADPALPPTRSVIAVKLTMRHSFYSKVRCRKCGRKIPRGSFVSHRERDVRSPGEVRGTAQRRKLHGHTGPLGGSSGTDESQPVSRSLFCSPLVPKP